MGKNYFLVAFLFLTFLLSAQSTPTGSSAEVGITDGQLEVSLSGAATYSLPIKVPPGINGVVPNIALSYNSQAGNSSAGYGWDISGLSTIMRIPSTKFHDGNVSTIKYSIDDHYALDGQRLIVKNGTSGAYGRDGTIYETENFSNVKITSYGAQGSNGDIGPAYFKVEYPDGSRAYYGYIAGNSSNSLSQIHFALTYWENAQGIRISYFYNTTIFDKLMLVSIKYGAKNDNTPPNEINFVYKDRALPDTQIIAGDYKRDLQVLSEINVKTNGIGYRNYVLSHDLSSLKYERLKSVTEKSGDNSKSLNPTIFTYLEDQPSAGTQIEWSRTAPGISLSSTDGKTLTGDFDGDGEAEFLSAPNSSQIVVGKINEDYSTKNTSFSISNSDKRYAVNSLDSNFGISSKQNLCIAVTENGQNKFKIYNFNSSLTGFVFDYEKSSPVSSGYPSKDLYGDFDGDYLTDLLVVNEPVNGICNLSVVNLDRRVASNFISSAGQIDTGVWNDNGAGLISGTHIMKIGDINGDGKSDIVIFRGAPYNDISGYTLKDGSFVKFIEWDYSIPGDIGDTSHYSVNEFPIIMGDYNGDGKSDIFFVATGKILISTGGVYFSEEILPSSYSPPTYPYTPYEQIVAFDFNNDGRSDIIRIKPGKRNYTPPNGPVYQNQETLEVFLYTKTRESNNQWGFQNFYRYVFPYPYGNFYNSADPDPYLIDINPLISRKSKLSPNKFELAVNVGAKVVFLSNNAFSSDQHLLKSITTGNGAKEDITYSSLKKDNGVYEAGGIKPYPYLAIQSNPEFRVVSQIDYPSNGQSKKIFKYFDAVNNVEGLGFMGFQSVLKSNLHNSAVPVISNIIKNNFLLRGANVENYSVDGLVAPSSATPGSFISKSVLEYNSAADALQSNKVFKLKNVSLKQYDGLTNTSSETSTDFDSYNNPVSISTVIRDGASVVQTSTKNLTYATPTESPYINGRVSSKAESVSYNGDTAASEEIYTYNSQQLLSQVKKRPDATVNYITEDCTYDLFGNLSSKTITAGGNSRAKGWAFDASGRFLLTETDIESLQTVFTYYPNGTVKTETNPYGQTLSYEYDSWFRKIKTTDYLQKVITYSYTKNTGDNTTTLSASHSDGTGTSDIYNALGQKTYESVKANVNGLFIKKYYFYDINGRIIEEGVPHYPYSIRRAQTYYDAYGRIIKYQGPGSGSIGDGTVITYSGLLSTFNDGAITRTVRKDAVGNIIEVNDGSGQLISYSYFANGNLKQSTCGGSVISANQDKWGRRIQLTDPSAGIIKYAYNDFNELIKEENDNGITTYIFNPLGKLEEKKIIGSNANSKTVYSYDAASKKISSSVFTDYFNGQTTITNTYFYDAWKRLYKSVETTPYATFTKTLGFDSFGRVDTETSAVSSGNKSSSKTLKRTYQNGAQYQILDGTTVLWQKDNISDNGELHSGIFGNGTNVIQDYSGDDYMINNLYRLGTTTLLKMETSFNAKKGNLESRNNSLFGYTEDFKYDSMNRLTDITTTSQYINCTFSTADKEGFIGENGGSVTSSAGGLSVAIPNANGAAKRSLLTGKSVGDELDVRFEVKKVLGTDTFNVYIQEQDPVTMATVKYFKGTLPTSATGAVMIINHTVVQYANIELRFEKVNTTSMNVFILDNVTGGQKSKTLQAYDAKGRIASNELGTYNYPSSGKIYQNSSININPSSLAYYQSRPTQIISYNTFKSPYQIEDAGIDKISFEYNDDNGRSAMFYGSTQDKLVRPLRKYYSADGTMEVKENRTTGTFEFLTYIGGDAYTAPIVLKSDGINENYLYLQRDYQGSIMAVANNSGAIIEKRLFDAWGGIISVQNGSGTTLSGLTVLDRGYTGHEHLQSVGIIHMNGRLYDPKLRRFLQPDNNIQDPFSAQNYNRYAYVMNNPLRYTDPSGEFWNVLFGYLFNAYVRGAYSNGGELNPAKWNSTGFINAATSTASLGASTVATNFTNNYLDNYNRPPELGISAVQQSNSIMFENTQKKGFSSSDTFDFLTTFGVASSAGNVINFKEMQGYQLDKSDFLIGSYNSSNAIDFAENVAPGRFALYEKGYKDALSTMKIVNTTGKVIAKTGYYAGYFEGGYKVLNGDVAGGSVSIGSNYLGESIGAGYGWGYGLAWQLTWITMDKLVSQTEWYNRLFFGKDSDTYRERGISNGWYWNNKYF